MCVFLAVTEVMCHASYAGRQALITQKLSLSDTKVGILFGSTKFFVYLHRLFFKNGQTCKRNFKKI